MLIDLIAYGTVAVFFSVPYVLGGLDYILIDIHTAFLVLVCYAAMGHHAIALLRGNYDAYYLSKYGIDADIGRRRIRVFWMNEIAITAFITISAHYVADLPEIFRHGATVSTYAAWIILTSICLRRVMYSSYSSNRLL